MFGLETVSIYTGSAEPTATERLSRRSKLVIGQPKGTKAILAVSKAVVMSRILTMAGVVD